MSFHSPVFLFLFLPGSLLVYFLLPAKRSLALRNAALLVFSLVFYAWGEPLRVLLIAALTVLTWALGRMADGARKTRRGRLAVALTVLLHAGMLAVYKYLAGLFALAGARLAAELPSLPESLPLGLSFFCFAAISYVVDVYRGRLQSKRSLFRAALYLTLFFKVVSGPVMQYNRFEGQIERRTVSFASFSEGMWRVILGLGKKILLAGVLGELSQFSFGADYGTLPAAVAWLGSFAYMLQLYFDFSGYSDMAIGLGRMFGFELPENFRYPYASASVTEYWQRWHKTLGEWFRDYLYYPLTLGPAIRIRRAMAGRFSKAAGKFVVNVFTLGVIWLCTGLWHGRSVNYVIWGLINGGVCLAELYKKPLKNQKLDRAIGWLYTFLVAFFVKTLTNITGLGKALSYFGAMFGLNGNPASSPLLGFLFGEYWVWLLVGTAAAFPLASKLHDRLLAADRPALTAAVGVVRGVFAAGVLVLSVAYALKTGYTAFIYQGF